MSLSSFVFLFSLSSFAGQFTQPSLSETTSTSKKELLAVLKSNVDSRVSNLFAMTDSNGKIQQIRLECGPEVQQFSLAQVSSKEGVVLLREQGYDVIKLKGQINNEMGAGMAVVSYLANATFGLKYQSCPAKIARHDKSEQWQILNVNSGRTVREMNIVVNSWGTGIETIQGICPQ